MSRHSKKHLNLSYWKPQHSYLSSQPNRLYQQGWFYICVQPMKDVVTLWETSLQSNAVSHWLGSNLKSMLWYTCCPGWFKSTQYDYAVSGSQSGAGNAAKPGTTLVLIFTLKVANDFQFCTLAASDLYTDYYQTSLYHNAFIKRIWLFTYVWNLWYLHSDLLSW